jgi:hypothetical protein
MAKWETYLGLVLSGDVREIGERDGKVVHIGRSAAALAAGAGALGR